MAKRNRSKSCPKSGFLQNQLDSAMGCRTSIVKPEAKQLETVVVEAPVSLPDDDTASTRSFDSGSSYESASTLEDFMDELPAAADRSPSGSQRPVERPVLQSAAQAKSAKSLKLRLLHSKLKTLFVGNLDRLDKGIPLKKIDLERLPSSAGELKDVEALKVLAKEYNEQVLRYENNVKARKSKCDAQHVVAGLYETGKELIKTKNTFKRDVKKAVGKKVASAAWTHRVPIYNAYKKVQSSKKTRDVASVACEALSESLSPAGALLNHAASLVVENQDLIFKVAQKYESAKQTKAEIEKYMKFSGEIAKIATEKTLEGLTATQVSILEIFS